MSPSRVYHKYLQSPIPAGSQESGERKHAEACHTGQGRHLAIIENPRSEGVRTPAQLIPEDAETET